MGRRNRLNKQAIIEGQARSIVQAKKDLMFEVVKRVTQNLFFDPAWSELRFGDGDEAMADLMMEVLPDALLAIGETRFHMKDLTKEKDWLEMGCRMIKGICARHTDQFIKKDSKGELWHIRKSKSGRKATGEWRLCVRCSSPFYVTRSRWRQVHHDRDCYWTAYREGTVVRHAHHGPDCRPDDPDEKKPLREVRPVRRPVRETPRRPAPVREPKPALR